MKKGITMSKAINKAISFFELQKSQGELDKRAEIRSIYLQEGTGRGPLYRDLSIRIEYSIDGDYIDSDSCPFVACVSLSGVFRG